MVPPFLVSCFSLSSQTVGHQRYTSKLASSVDSGAQTQVLSYVVSTLPAEPSLQLLALYNGDKEAQVDLRHDMYRGWP